MPSLLIPTSIWDPGTKFTWWGPAERGSVPTPLEEEGMSFLVGVVSKSLDTASSMTAQRAGFSWAQGSGGETREGGGKKFFFPYELHLNNENLYSIHCMGPVKVS